MNPEPLLNDEQVEKILLSLHASRGEEGFTEDEAAKVLDWASDAIIQIILLEGIFEGTFNVNIKEGETVFSLTEKGMKEAQTLSSMVSNRIH